MIRCGCCIRAVPKCTTSSSDSDMLWASIQVDTYSVCLSGRLVGLFVILRPARDASTVTVIGIDLRLPTFPFPPCARGAGPKGVVLVPQVRDLVNRPDSSIVK
jgi:hypothetical protein